MSGRRSGHLVCIVHMSCATAAAEAGAVTSRWFKAFTSLSGRHSRCTATCSSVALKKVKREFAHEAVSL